MIVKTKFSLISDLFIVIFLEILAAVFILVPPFNQNFLRVLLALPLLLLFPGYLFISAMFPKKDELSPIERFTLSVGLSIAITVFDGFVISVTPWRFRPNSIVASLMIISIILTYVTIFLRIRTPEDRRFSIHLVELFKYLSDGTRNLISELRSELRIKDNKRNPLSKILDVLVRPGGNKYPDGRSDHEIEKVLIITMVLSIIIASSMLIYAKVTHEPEKFSALYILGKEGKAEDYVKDVVLGIPLTMTVGIENYEHRDVEYSLRIKLDDNLLKEMRIFLKHDTKWKDNITFTPELSTILTPEEFGDRSKLVFELSIDNSTDVYRSVHLWVTPIYQSMEPLSDSSLPFIQNGDMELNNNWLFINNDPLIEGEYSTEEWSSQFHSYEIRMISDSIPAGSNGSISQMVKSNDTGIALLTFDVKSLIATTNNNINPANYSYLASWNDIPGNDSERLTEYLGKNFGIDWVKAAKIEKIDGGKTIKVYNGKKFISLGLNDEETEVNLKISDGRTDKLDARRENGNVNIYDYSKKIYIQVLQDNKKVWEYDAAKISNWHRIMIPVYISHDNEITFNLYKKENADLNANVWFDNIMFKKADELIRKSDDVLNDNSGYAIMEQYRELRGEAFLASAGKTATVNGLNFQGFESDAAYYSSYENLTLHFSEDRKIGIGGAIYTAMNHSGIITFDSRYLYNYIDQKTSYISKIVQITENMDLKPGRVWNLKDGYTLRIKSVNITNNTAVMELRKPRKLLKSASVGIGEDLKYSIEMDNKSWPIFKTSVKSIKNNSVVLSDTLLYDSPIRLKTGNMMGDFVVVEFNEQSVKLENAYTIVFSPDRIFSMFNNTIYFKIYNNSLTYPFIMIPQNTTIKVTGTIQKIPNNGWLNISGLNFQAFNSDFENNKQYEHLDMYISDGRIVEIGNATYQSARFSDKISLLGENYKIQDNQNQINYIQKILYSLDNKRLDLNSTWQPVNSMMIRLREIAQENRTARVDIRSNNPKLNDLLNETLLNNKKEINDSNLINFIADYTISYSVRGEIIIYKKSNFRNPVKSDLIEIGDVVTYRIFDEDNNKNFDIFRAEVSDINDTSILLKDIGFYSEPLGLFAGKRFDDFEITNIDHDSITLKNLKPLFLEPEKEIKIGKFQMKIFVNSVYPYLKVDT